jgi:cytosine/adenosine deaminase-related metal-dependent hydrolase
MTLLLRGGRIMSEDGTRMVPADVLIEGDRIAEVRPNIDVRPGWEELDATGKLILPGFMNCHNHSHTNLGRGHTGQWPVELSNPHNMGLLSPRPVEDQYLSAALGAIELLKSGCTSVCDMFNVFPAANPEVTEAIVRGQVDVGLRLLIAPAVSDITAFRTVPGLMDRLPTALCSTALGVQAASTETILQVTEDTIKRWHGALGGRVRCTVAPTIPGQCTDEFLDGAKRMMDEYGVGMQTHLLETRVQGIYAQERWGRTVVAELHRRGLLGPNTVGSQAIWLDDDDIAMIADTGTVLVHNAASNLRLGSGIAPIREFLDKGVDVALGTDAVLCSDNLNMFESMRFAAVVGNVRFPHDVERWLSPLEVWRMAMKGGARAMGLANDLGEVAPGRLADLCLLDEDTTYLTPLNNPVAQFVFSENGSSVDTVLVGGEIVVQGGKCTKVDEKEIRRRVREAVARTPLPANPKLAEMAEELSPHIIDAMKETLDVPFPVNRFAAPLRSDPCSCGCTPNGITCS